MRCTAEHKGACLYSFDKLHLVPAHVHPFREPAVIPEVSLQNEEFHVCWSIFHAEESYPNCAKMITGGVTRSRVYCQSIFAGLNTCL
jgi:hypothetical protein